MDDNQFGNNVKVLYQTKRGDVGPLVIAEWFRLALQEKWTDDEIKYGFDKMRASGDEFPSPGKMNAVIKAHRPVFSVDAIVPPKVERVVIDFDKKTEPLVCECGQPGITFGYTPIRCCGQCFLKMMKLPRAERIAAGIAVGIPVLENGRVAE